MGLLGAQYIGFIAIGLISSMLGPLLPTVQGEIAMDYTQAGLLLSGQFLGMVPIALLGGRWADKYGKKRFLLWGGGLLTAGLAGCMFSHSYLSLLVWMVLSGIGFGIYEVGINALCADSAGSAKGKSMNFLHFFFGVGAIMGPALATGCILLFGSWRAAFGLSILPPLLVSIILLKNVPASIPQESKVAAHERGFYQNSFIWLTGLFCFVYVGIEVTMYGWLPTFWKTIAPADSIPPSLIAMFFWLALTIGRLLAGRAADRIGFSRYITLTCGCVALLSLSWMLLPTRNWTLITTLIMGLLLAGLYPTIMASATAYNVKRSGEIAGFVSLFAAIGGFAIPSGIGGFIDSFGVNVVPTLLFVLSLLLCVSAIWRWSLQVKQEQNGRAALADLDQKAVILSDPLKRSELR